MLAMVALVVLGFSSSPPQPCVDMPESSQEALRRHLATYHGLTRADCVEEFIAASRSVVDEGEDVLGYLLHIYEHGLDGTELWPAASPAPEGRDWTLQLIGEIDATKAIGIRRVRYVNADGDLKRRLEEARALVELGDASFLSVITNLLKERPPNARADIELRRLIGKAIDLLARQDYRPALDVLRSLEAEDWNNDRLSVYIAQLAGDVEALTVYASSRSTVAGALDSLLIMGRSDVVEELSRDPHYRYASAARRFLARQQPD